jgi:hypothetical protein
VLVIKEEPLDLIPDMEFDLIDIEKEEPFSGQSLCFNIYFTSVFSGKSRVDETEEKNSTYPFLPYTYTTHALSPKG